MRTSWLLLGALLGLVGYYAYLTQEQETEAAKQPQTKPMKQPGEQQDHVQRAAAPKQPVAAGSHPVAEMVDEVVHHQDIPETPFKQAFEQALGG